MTELISTEDLPALWVDDIRENEEPVETRDFLFSHEKGHLLVHESVKAREVGSMADSSSGGTGMLKEKKTMTARPDRLRVPSAKLLIMVPDERYILLKKYEGFVTSRNEQGFSARLSEGDNDYPVIEAEFDLEELSESDRKLAIVGAAIVWTIGYRYDGSTRKRESSIYVRRLPKWTDKEIEQANRAAEELTRGIKWE